MYTLTQNSGVWLISIGLFFQLSLLKAQSWTDLKQFGNAENQEITVLGENQAHLYFGGSFSGGLDIGTHRLQSQGGADIFIAQQSGPDQILRILLQGGSLLDDAIDALAIDAQGNLFVTGSFWTEIDFGTFVLESPPESPKALFLIKISPEGALLWSQVFTKGSVKGINSIALDTQGGVLLGGYFSEEIEFADTVLQSPARSAAFYALLTSTGDLQWSRAIGKTGNTRINGVSTFEGTYYQVAGYYDDTLSLAGQTFPANTNDQDVFLLSMDTAGEIRWVRKAGGVFDETVADMVNDSLGNTYLCGQLVGVMRLNDSLSIQSRDGNADCFLLKYDSLGQAIWAKSFGGDRLQFVNDLLIDKGKLTMCGAFQDNLFLDDFSLTSTFEYDGYFAQINLDGEVIDLHALSAENGNVLPVLLSSFQEELIIGGAFSGQVQVAGLEANASPGTFQIFLATWGAFLSATQALIDDPAIQIFPNPASHTFSIQGVSNSYGIKVYNTAGQLILQQDRPNAEVGVQDWLPGLYFVHINLPKGQLVRKLMVH